MPGKRFTAEKIIKMLREVEVLVERLRREYNHIRPHKLIGVSISCTRGHYPDGSVGIRVRSTSHLRFGD